LNELAERYDTTMMAAYVRGVVKGSGPLFEAPLEKLSEEDCLRLLDTGRERELKTHYFKRHEALPRVKVAMGFLRGIQPESLLDVGSGRGVFLFPFMREFPRVPVTSLDILEKRVALLNAIHDGGVENLTALNASICDWDAPDGSFDVITLLEVLEHIPEVQAAVRNAVRLARRYVVVTVPSKPDDNPEHIHLLTKPVLTALFHDAGCENLRFDGVPGHLFMVAKVGKE
jgi:2-polyprenyl-3-methyl-5-hydroxy-6-metoxy-1,4-benzoquinol methylase